MHTTLRSALIVGATTLFAVIGTAQAADFNNGGYASARSYLNQNINSTSRAKSLRGYRNERTSVRRLVKGILNDVGVRSVAGR